MERLSIVKIGGKIINDSELLDQFLNSFQKIEGAKVLVHGGGRAATELSKKMGIEVKMIEGRRITDAETLDIAVMTYAGLINKTIVASLQAKACQAIGLSGADGNLIQSHKREVGAVDYGFVGDIDKVNDGLLVSLLGAEVVPVLCPITHNAQGQLLNTNADTIAAAVTQAMSEHYRVTLKYCFEYNGVLERLDDPNSIIKLVTEDAAKNYISTGIFSDGMIPKVENVFHALRNGADQVSICGINYVHEKSPGTTFTL